MISIKHILNNLGANSFSMIINLSFQIILVPVFIIYWGVDLYGEWLVLTALTAYFSMTDIGLNTVTSNEFSMSYSKNNFQRCNILMNNNLFFIVIVFGILIFLVGFLLQFIDLSELFGLKQMSERVAEIGLILLAFQVFTGMLGNLMNAVYRATQHYAGAIMIGNGILIAENLILLIGVIYKFPIDLIFITYVIPRFIGLFIKYFDSRKYYQIHIGIKYINKIEFKRIIMPSLYFLSFPIGNSIILQGFTLLINFMLGSAAVVLFNTTRTMVNIIKAGLGLINNSVWPEMSLAYGRRDYNSMKKLHRYAVGTSFYFALFIVIALLIIGEPLFLLWTDARVEFDWLLFSTFLLTLIFNTIWFTSSVVLAATNNHKRYSIIYLVSTFISLGIAYCIIKMTGQVRLLPISLLIIDILLIGVIIKQSLVIVNDEFNDFLRSAISTPAKILKSIRT